MLEYPLLFEPIPWKKTMTLTGRARYLWIALAVLAIDQVSKIWVHATLPGEPPVVVVPNFFNLIYSRNAGGLFGYFGGMSGGVRAILLIALPIGAVAMILWLILKSQDEDRRTRIALSLILGGAVGNLIDRIFRGEVVDFLDVYVSRDLFPGTAEWLITTFDSNHWATFNVADSAIVCGACLLLLAVFFPGQEPGSENPGQE